MANIEIRLPKMGESVTEATITNWLKNIGDSVQMDESLVAVATDKVDNELPSEAQGILVKRFFEVDQVAQVGDVIAIISTSTEGDTPNNTNSEETSTNDTTPSPNTVDEIMNKAVDLPSDSVNPSSIKSTEDRFYSPLVKSIAKTENISQQELDSISGTGQNGRVTKHDILAYINNRATIKVEKNDEIPHSNSSIDTLMSKTDISTKIDSLSEIKQRPPSDTTVATSFLSSIKPPVVTVNPNDEIIEMDRMRKLIAEHMVMSTHVSPHVTSYVEADVTTIVNWRNKVKDSYRQREGENLTFTPIFIEAVVRAILDFPMINVSVNGTQIIKRKDINIGMATALPSGNLIVPVIKNADLLNLNGLTKSVNRLANNARKNALKPEDIQGGTYTVTNVGTFGNVMGTPIINQPQVAILALGAIRKVPAVIETPQGDFIGIRHKMFLSHSYDHRVVDGALGGQFVRRVADYLEQFDINRLP